MTVAGQGLFAGTGAIGRYWQARCIGFEVRSVDGARVGVVRRVALNPESRCVHALYVQPPHRAVVEVEPASVAFVDPWQRVLIVEQTEEHRSPISEASTVVEPLPAVPARSTPIAWHQAVPLGVAAARRAGVVGRSAGAKACSAAPPARRFATWLAKRAAYAAAFLLWLYGALVYVATRVVARVLFVSLAVLAQGVRWAGPRWWNATRKAVCQARDFSSRHSVSSR